jgi:hypothetical protein
MTDRWASGILPGDTDSDNFGHWGTVPTGRLLFRSFHYRPTALLEERVTHMRIHTWYGALGIIAVTASATVACSSSTTSTPTDDAGAVDAGGNSEVDSAAEAQAEAAATGDGGSCSLALDTGSADCDTCVETSCCTALTTCDTPDDGGVDDAGTSQCELLLGCINDFNSTSDAGVDAGGGETACAPSYTAEELTNATGVLTCIRTSCATQCPGL